MLHCVTGSTSFSTSDGSRISQTGDTEQKGVMEGCKTITVADLDSKILDARSPGRIFFIFMQFSGNFGRTISPPLGWPPS